ncbi:MAG: peptidase M3 [Planctomycetes bacterium]|nr:peptidase M3 [Planctomycetota bacterium]
MSAESATAAAPLALAEVLRAALAECRARVERFRSARGGEPLAVLREFDRLLQPLNGVEGRVGLFVAAHPEAEVRERCEGFERALAELRTELSLERGLFERLVALDERELPEGEPRRLLGHALRDFRRSGVDRDAATRARLRGLQEELVVLGQEFDRNIIAGGRELVIHEGPAALDGLPADFVAAHPPRADGTLVLGTDPHVRMAFLTYATRGDLRREYYQVATNRAVPQNLGVLPRLLAKRHELATTLGYAHWADYATEDKMTRSAAAARGFLERLLDKVRVRARAERDELLSFKRRREPAATAVFEWERAYWLEQVKAERFQLDSLALRSYFPFARVKQGVLDTAAELFGLEFRRARSAEVWHPSVECWELHEGGELRARFYFDLFPRPGKYKHAAMFPVQDGLSGETLPEAVLLCNFPEPSAGDPALLLHDQVTTFFHEFGHLLHHVLAGRGRWLAFAGIATERDFVEVPSQLFEEWAWDPAVLARFARHVDSDEPIPAELVRKLRAAEDYGKGLTTETQLFYGLLALGFYDRDPRALDLSAEMIALKERTCCLPHTDGTHFHASFGHLNGYSALYYTYLWSLVIAKDLLTTFQERMMGREAALRYRRCILEPGGALDAAEMVCEFLGREYEFAAFERWLVE